MSVFETSGSRTETSPCVQQILTEHVLVPAGHCFRGRGRNLTVRNPQVVGPAC